MRRRNWLLMTTGLFLLSLVISAQGPQTNPPSPQVNQDRIEAAHGKLLSGEDRAKDASRLTEAVAPVLPDSASSTAPVPRKNFIDEHIFGRMERDKIPHAPLAGDEEFLRRAYLDATGLLPSPDQVRSFIRDTDPNKRDKLIDSLIGTEEFTDQWAYHFGELLRTREAQFHLWTKQWLKVDRPYNDVFADIVTPTTKNAKGFPTAQGFYDPIGYIATRCGLWTDADDYKGLNRLDWVDEIRKMRNIGYSDGSARNFYGGSSLFDDLAPGYNTGNDGVFYTPAEGRFPRDGKTYEPAFLLTGEKPKPGEDPRKALARILPNHIQFARATVNIVWQKLMVIGLVEPYDGFDLMRLDPKNPPPKPWTIQPSNPELLEALAEDFRSHNYSIHRVIKNIMKSNAYQLSASFAGEWKDAYIPYHARRFARVLTGPEAVDIVTQATATPFDWKLYGADRQYVKELTSPLSLKGDGGGGGGALNAGPSPEKSLVFAFMQAYYQAERALPPVDKNIASPVQAMMMMTSPVVTKRVGAQGNTRVANLVKAGKSDDEILEELFLASLTRRPTADEVEVAKRVIAKDRNKGIENIQWALLNSAEFLVNH
ncbi:MAG: hypothetical protein DMG20_09745 [Acidobacteria bacterium]|nr:MAG: hypothetical protein DMG20_09745 [Acidobacteriota bacterium]